MAEPMALLLITLYVGVPLAIVVYTLTLLHHMAADLKAIRREMEHQWLHR